MKLAIHPDLVRLPGGGEPSLSRRWTELAQAAGVRIRLVDALAEDALDAIRPCDGFVWHFAVDRPTATAAKLLLMTLEQGMGLPSYPDWRDAWHFADAPAQAAVLEAAGLPTPQTWIFWTEGDALDFLRDAAYPLRMPTRSGEGRAGDRLVHDARHAEAAARRVFAADATARGSLLGMVLRGTRDLAMDDEHDVGTQRACLLLQEVLPVNAMPRRLLVVGERAWPVGDVLPQGVAPELLELAFRAAAQLRAQSLLVDVALHDGMPLVTRVRYAPAVFPPNPVGHWRRAGLDWHVDPLRAEDAVFDAFLARVRAGVGHS